MVPEAVRQNRSRLQASVVEAGESRLADVRFRTLLGEAAWATLPETVRRRFSKRLAPDETLFYRGQVVTTELSGAGWVLAFVLRAIGAPLPLAHGATGSALVAVTEDPSLGGQTWTRLYARPGKFPQVIHSAKRFCGPTGLEEYVGYGIAMALTVSAEEGALVFRSESFSIGFGSWRWQLPRMLEPGSMEIAHQDEGDGDFTFRLVLTHPLFGRLVHQLVRFADEDTIEGIGPLVRARDLALECRPVEMR